MRNKQRTYDRFVNTTSEWLKALEGYDAEHLKHKPAPDQWSLAELYDHLMRVANTYQIPHFLNCANNGTKRLSGKNYKGMVIFDVDYLPGKKMRMENFPPDIVRDFTPVVKEKNILLKEFEGFIRMVQNDLQTKLMNADTNLKEYHPLFGWINAVEWFSLIEIHIRHHLPQRTRLEQAKATQTA
ncbi:MAG: DinB family protein [Bacteroidota bacterium]